MKKYYDKVLFLLALVVLALGASLFYFKGGIPKPGTLPSLKTTGATYTAIDKPDFTLPNPEWDNPPDQGGDDNPGWVFDLSTPPKIWWDPTQGWVVEAPNQNVAPPPPFGLKLVKAKPDLYRIQLEGTSGSGEKDDYLVFDDLEKGFSFKLQMDKEGVPPNDDNQKTSKLHEIQIQDVQFDQVDMGHGVTLKRAKVTLLDTRSGEKVTLTQGVPYSPSDNQLYYLQTEDPLPAKDWTVSKNNPNDNTLTVDGSAEGYKGDITYKVVALDFNKPSVTVQKSFTNKKNKQITLPPKELTISAPAATDAASAPAPASP